MSILHTAHQLLLTALAATQIVSLDFESFPSSPEFRDDATSKIELVTANLLTLSENFQLPAFDANLAKVGAEVYQRNACIACHATELGQLSFGPNHRNLFGNLTLTDKGRVLAGTEYIRESLANPDAQKVQGKSEWSPSPMPDFKELSGKDTDAIVMYLRSISDAKGLNRNTVTGDLSSGDVAASVNSVIGSK